MSARSDGDRPELVVVCGLPGVGKTTVAETIRERADGDATLLRTDIVRTDVVDDPEYTEEELRRVYDELFSRANDCLARAESVVVDGTFKRAVHRERARDLAADHDAQARLVRVECDEETVRERISARTEDASDADFDVYKLYKEEFEPIEDSCITIDNSGSTAQTRERVIDALY
ncbi:AAA family ATPase [Salarchaeum sp. JOR-1]|uniref:AAA family ATPase n=1 Tax=Salarchaeum sp. JOR-1 TaxID=2599399 RepID=UPI001198A1FA|nr:AAA family ATPase [Salarchaeum sp. JOR-1]QDX41345.1 AAA family ATPase [Salarchaeum sp. JOR-1]